MIQTATKLSLSLSLSLSLTCVRACELCSTTEQMPALVFLKNAEMLLINISLRRFFSKRESGLNPEASNCIFGTSQILRRKIILIDLVTNCNVCVCRRGCYWNWKSLNVAAGLENTPYKTVLEMDSNLLKCIVDPAYVCYKGRYSHSLTHTGSIWKDKETSLL
jgi:hypothetical protein